MRTNSVSDSLNDASSRRDTTLTAIRHVVFVLMGFLRPLVSLSSLTLSIVCVALLLFSLTFPRGTHFPGVLIGGIALVCLAAHYGYGLLMALVAPIDRTRSR